MLAKTSHNAARMQRRGVEILATVAAFKLVGEVDVSCLGLSISDPFVVRTRFCEVDVVKQDPAVALSQLLFLVYV